MPTAHKILTLSNTPTQISGVEAGLSSAKLFGFRGFNTNGQPINNNSGVYFGISNSGQLAFNLGTGSLFSLDFSTKNQRESLSNIWFNGATGDGIYVIYYP